MADLDYEVGTVSIAADGTTVTGTATIFTSNVRKYDTIVVDGVMAHVRAVVDATHLTITKWKGATVSGAAYTIEQTSPLRFNNADAMTEAYATLAALAKAPIFVGPSDAAPDAKYGNEQQYAWQPTTQKLWQRQSGAWAYLLTLAGLLAANNLGDVTNAAVARSNLGLGSSNSPTFAALNVAGAIDAGAIGSGSQNFRSAQFNALFATDGAFVVTGKASLSTGIALRSMDNTYSNFKGFEFVASSFLFTSGNITIGSTTPSTSTTTGALTVGGGIGAAGRISAPTILATAVLGSALPHLDTSLTASTVVAGNSSAIIGTCFCGLLLVRENFTYGYAAMFFLSNGGATVVANPGGGWSATTSPASNLFGVGYDGSNFRVYNGSASSLGFTITFIKTT